LGQSEVSSSCLWLALPGAKEFSIPPKVRSITAQSRAHANPEREARARPMGTGDLLGDLRERRITHAGILKTIFRHRDGVAVAMSFAHQPRTGLQAEAGG
jgi:hypothetical protein